MVASLIARSLSVAQGALRLLDNVDLTVAEGDRIGLVGPNGAGKSSLLRVLAGEAVPEDGSVLISPPTATVGLLPQEPSRSAESAESFLRRRVGISAAQKDFDESLVAVEQGATGSAERYDAALNTWLRLGAADFDARMHETWSELGLPPDRLAQSTSSLSGGEAARCSLASILLSQFDIVLLDEPTNDFDLASLQRLEAWVLRLKSPLVVVSHDRTFLDRTITSVVEIDPHHRSLTQFGGGWAGYLLERDRARAMAERRFLEYSHQRQALAERSQKQREWASQGQSKVRKSDESDKHIRNFKLDQTEKLAGKAAQTQRALDRLEVVDKPFEPWRLNLEIPTAPRGGSVVATATGARLDRGTFTLGPVNLVIEWGDRIALTGENGSGKTTLIELLLGRIQPTAGTRSLGPTVVVGAVEQARAAMIENRPLLDVFQDRSQLSMVETRTLLAKFNIGSDHVVRSAATLSAGERTRVSLALLMANGANLLVLDEPTNHLDLEAVEQLEQALDTFDGTVILVTHDRAMLERVRITRWFTMRNGQISEDR
ncbi:MAG: ABC-F family ATP-binding cassette domain-containing protein [Acidimicrobiales bacterium]|nr:ABC-F family ATP-binding cassette domain-containing protein [Acidimicrobiales bacterium]